MENIKNKTNIHENYGSIEEFEADFNRLTDAISNVHDVALSTKLPPVIIEGMMYSGLTSFDMSIHDEFKAMESKKALSDLFALLESDGKEGE